MFGGKLENFMYLQLILERLLLWSLKSTWFVSPLETPTTYRTGTAGPNTQCSTKTIQNPVSSIDCTWKQEIHIPPESNIKTTQFGWPLYRRPIPSSTVDKLQRGQICHVLLDFVRYRLWKKIIWDKHQVLNMPFVAKMPTGKYTSFGSK